MLFELSGLHKLIVRWKPNFLLVFKNELPWLSQQQKMMKNNQTEINFLKPNYIVSPDV